MLSVLLNKTVEDANKYILKHWSEELPYFTGLEILCDDVYNICPGTAVYIGNDENNKKVVNIYINNTQLVRYCNLVSVDVKEGQHIKLGEHIGTVHKSFRFEYCSSEKSSSNWPVRVMSNTYYKQNPEGLLDGSTKLDSEYIDTSGISIRDAYMEDYQDIDEIKRYGPDNG